VPYTSRPRSCTRCVLVTWSCVSCQHGSVGYQKGHNTKMYFHISLAVISLCECIILYNICILLLELYLIHYVTVLYKSLPNALIYVNTTLFTLSQSYMFQPSSGHPQGVQIHFMSGTTKYVSRCNYQTKEQKVLCYVYIWTCILLTLRTKCQYSMRMNLRVLKHVGV